MAAFQVPGLSIQFDGILAGNPYKRLMEGSSMKTWGGYCSELVDIMQILISLVRRKNRNHVLHHASMLWYLQWKHPKETMSMYPFHLQFWTWHICANALGYIHVIYEYQLVNKCGFNSEVQGRKKATVPHHNTNRTCALTLVSLDYLDGGVHFWNELWRTARMRESRHTSVQEEWKKTMDGSSVGIVLW